MRSCKSEDEIEVCAVGANENSDGDKGRRGCPRDDPRDTGDARVTNTIPSP